MPVRCSKCGEELLGAVNRCWKCGQALALHPETDGRPPVRAQGSASQQTPLAATVLDNDQTQVVAALPAAPAKAATYRQPQTSEIVDARRASMMAMGGTVASIVLGIFAALLALLWPPAAIIAVLGLVMGIWGLRSPRRNLALVGMLLCCLAIGLGAFGGARALYVHVQSNRAIRVNDTP
jgi:hypothetical protein